MAGFQDTSIQRVAQMSGKKYVEQFFLNPQFQSKTATSDHFCVVSIILKQYSSSMWCDLFTVNKFGLCGKLFWAIINPIQYSGHNEIPSFRIQVPFIFQSIHLDSAFEFLRLGLLKVIQIQKQSCWLVNASGQTIITLGHLTVGNVKLLAFYKKGITMEIGLHRHNTVVDSLKCSKKQKV